MKIARLDKIASLAGSLLSAFLGPVWKADSSI
jgi:hypothetical protein